LKDFLNDIKQRILSEVPEIKTVRLWNNQIEQLIAQRNESISFPAVFLGFDEGLEWQSKSQKGIQYSEDLALYVRVVGENYVDNTYDDSTEWGIFDLKESVYKALQSYDPVNASELDRIREQTDESHDSIYIYTQVYRIDKLVDTTACPPTTPVDATLDLTVDLNIENIIIRTGRLGGDIPPPTEDIQLDYQLDFRVN